MIEVTLRRTCSAGDMGTFGSMEITPDLRLFTVERPWLDNQPFVSCIPTGRYRVNRHTSPKFGTCWILSGDTVGHTDGERTHILIHAANRAAELQGCIAPGLKLGTVGNDWAVISSRDALNKMLHLLPDQWWLTISSLRQSQTNGGA